MVTHHRSLFGLPTGTTVVASSLSGSDPQASFTFDAENDTVLVRHFGGDTFDGSDGTACTASVTRISRGSVCRAFDAAYERLYVVREGPDDRR